MTLIRRFFSGPSLTQAILAAARHHGVEPDSLVYEVIDKKHGFVKTPRGVVIEVDPERPTASAAAGPPEPATDDREPAAAEAEAAPSDRLAALTEPVSAEYPSWTRAVEPPPAPLAAEARPEPAAEPPTSRASEELEPPAAELAAAEPAAAETTQRESPVASPEGPAPWEMPAPWETPAGDAVDADSAVPAAESAEEPREELTEELTEEPAEAFAEETAAEPTLVVDDDLRNAVAAAVDELAHLAGLRVQVGSTAGDEDGLTIELEGPDSQRVVANEGRALLAIQHLLPRVLFRELGRGVRCRLDCAGFHAARAERLERLARKAADRVRSGGRPWLLEPMAPDERRLVHLALADEPDVETESVGEGYLKRVRVART